MTQEDAVTFAIAEDEPIEREGMERFLVRSFPEVRVIWTCGDGESALEALHRESPEVIIVDIEMPVISGLELCKKLYEEHYSGVILIHTAYSKFSYAKQAITLKVFDYMLKPMDNSEMYAAIQSCIAEARRRRREQTQKRQQDHMTLELTQYALSMLAKTAISREEAQTLFKIAGKRPQVYLIHLSSRRPFSSEEMRAFAKRQDQLRRLGLCAASVTDLAKPGDSHAMKEHTLRDGMACDMYLYAEDLNPARSYSCVWLLAVSCLLDAPSASAFVSRVSEDGYSDQTESASPSGEMPPLSDSPLARLRIPARTWCLIRKRNAEKCRSVLERYLRDRLYERISRPARQILSERPQEQETLFWELVQIYTEALLSVWPEASLETLISHAGGAAEEWLDAYEELCREMPLPDKGDAFESLLQWMQECFAREVSLTSAAERMGLDTAYFSRLFKKKTGKNFSDVLTDIRMRHAETLLCEQPDLSLEELSDACGFSSKTYFSEVFKKWKGMTLTQYLKTRKP